jgi:hypothetical protein
MMPSVHVEVTTKVCPATKSTMGTSMLRVERGGVRGEEARMRLFWDYATHHKAIAAKLIVLLAYIGSRRR